MKRERGTRNPTRDGLADYIEDNPGTSFTMLQRVFRLNEGTLRYHLEYLIGEDRILMAKKGHSKYYYPCGKTKLIDGLTLEESRIARIIEGNPGIPRSELREISGQGRDNVNRTLRKLKEMRLIWMVGNGGDPRYEYITEQKIALEMLSIIMERYLDGKIDKENFLALKRRIEENGSSE